MDRHLGKNLVIAGALVSAGFLGAWLRFRSHLGSESLWTNGAEAVDLDSRDELRFAVWGAPEFLPGTVNGGLDELGGSLSVDGRFLVFASGERGLGADLYIAAVEEGAILDVRAIEGLNTRADECAPALTAGMLYFASDRSGGAGGLDLYRASFHDGIFGPPERLGGSLATTSDETDPAPLPSGDSLVFASDRGGRATKDHDLFLARAVVGAVGTVTDWSVLPIRELATPFDERDAAFSNDGRILYFASNRENGGGDFDLFRCVRGAVGDPDRFLAPERLAGLSTDRAERSPHPSADGFTLLYASEGEEHGFDLARARTLELFRSEGRPVGTLELVLFGSLLLVAMLAWLAKRWERLDVLYRCLVVSIVVHGLFLFWMRTVYTQGGGPAAVGGGGQLIRLSIGKPRRSDASSDAARNLERGGTVEAPGRGGAGAPSPERVAALGAGPSWLGAKAEAPGAELQAPRAGEAGAPERMAAEHEPVAPGNLRAVGVRPSGERVERMSARASESALVASGGAPRASGGVEGSPARPLSGPVSVGDSRPKEGPATVLAGRATVGELGAEPGRASAAPARSDAPGVATVVAGPTEKVAPIAGSARSEPLLVPQASDGIGRAEGSGPERAEIAGASRPVSVGEIRPKEGSAGVLAGGATVGELGAEPGRESAAPTRSDTPGVATALARPAETVAPMSGPASSETQLVPQVSDSIGRAEGSGPERAEIAAAGRLEGSLPAPSSLQAAGLVAAADSSSDLPDAPSPVPPAAVREVGASEPRHVALAGPAEQSSAPIVAGTEGAPGDWLPSAQTFSPEHAQGALDLGRLATSSGTLSEIRPDARTLEPLARASASSSEVEPVRKEFESARPSSAPFAVDIAAAPAPAHEPSSEVLASSGLAAVEHASPGVPVPIASFPLERGGMDRPERFRASAPETSAPEMPASRVLFAEASAPDDDRAPGRDLGATPYRARVGAEKLLALEQYGGSKETEAAVSGGLGYLAGIQSPQGFWGAADDRHEKYGHVAVGKTALALLAFLGAGHTPVSSTEHAEVARKAVDFLLAIQDGPTGHFGYTEAYSHGIATYALAECYAITHEERLRAPIERAVGQILLHQESNDDPRFFGGWGYYYPDGRVFDPWPRVSITAWQVMALESAQLGGLTIDSHVFARAKGFLQRAWDEDRGAFRYSHDPTRLGSGYDILPGSTPAAMFALSLLGEDVASETFARARRFVLERAPRSYRFTGSDDFVHRAQGNLYFWYYGTLAMFRVGNAAWERWNVAMKDTLLPAQESNGSWRPICVYADYAGDDDADRSYTTAINVLTLEIYYRYFTPLLRVQ